MLTMAKSHRGLRDGVAAVIGCGLLLAALAPLANAKDNAAFDLPLDVPGSTPEGTPAVDEATGECAYLGSTIPCWDDGGWWNGECYAHTYSTDPNDPDSVKKAWWDSFGRTSGMLLQCRNGDYGPCFVSEQPPYWVDTQTQPPSLQELSDAAHLLIQGTVTAPGIGVFPGGLADGHPQASGLVGVPTWFWAENPGPGVGSRETKSTSVNGYTLEATVSFVETVYDTGDGHTVTCGLGSAPVNVHRPKESPSGCGHTYMEPGTYTITATTYVEVNWSGAGQSGRFELVVDRTGEYRMGENQVVIVP
jgi:hypothetical protein